MYVLFIYLCIFFFFKQKTAYEMRISDWSSDVCSSDLPLAKPRNARHRHGIADCLVARSIRGGLAAVRDQRVVVGHAFQPLAFHGHSPPHPPVRPNSGAGVIAVVPQMRLEVGCQPMWLVKSGRAMCRTRGGQ